MSRHDRAPIQLRKLHVIGAYVLQGTQFYDARGYFREIMRHDATFPVEVQSPSGLQQISVSHSRRDALRGMHKSPYSKFVSVLSGEVYDVICDVRPESPTFRQWVAVRLSAESGNQLYVPAGVAHGFLCLKEATVLYLQGGVFDPPAETDINAFCDKIDIFWPPPFENYVQSLKDANAPALAESIPKHIEMRTCKRVLVIGAMGQLGQAITACHHEDHVVGTYNSGADQTVPYKLDLRGLDVSSEHLESLLEMVRPHIIYLCAGLTWVDGCEICVQEAQVINGVAPGIITRLATRIGAKTVFFSTDYVFEGTKKHGYVESDKAEPLNVYGESKRAGEKNVLLEDRNALVIRTTGLFGPDLGKKNFVYQLCDALRRGETFKCPCDQFGAPTYTVDLARITKFLVNEGASGIFHCVGPETVNRYEFAVRIAKMFNLPERLISSISTEEQFNDSVARHGLAAKRGNFLGLKSERLQTIIKTGEYLRSIEHALIHWKNNPMGASLP